MLQFTTLSHWMVSLRDRLFGVRDRLFGVRDRLFGVRDRLFGVRDRLFGVQPTMVPLSRPPLSQLARLPVKALPEFVQDCPEAMQVLTLLGDLDWEHFPERPTNRAWPGPTPAPRAPFAAAYLVKLEERLPTFKKLRKHLVQHPALV